MAFVLYYASNGNPLFLCSGTLVSSNVVLTAGHCAVDENTGAPLYPSGYRVVTGSVDWTNTTDAQTSTVSQTLIDPNFDPATVDNDAALLVLSAPVGSPSIPLWASGDLFAGTGGRIAGWGDTYAGEPFAQQTVLQSAPTVVQNIDYCAAEAPLGYLYDSSTELCAVNAPTFDTGTCNGDSGGPLLVHSTNGSPVEAGITSVGRADCDTVTADYFTALLPIEPWIASEVSAVAPAPPPPPPTTTTPPATTTTTPNPALPTMTKADARSYVRQVIAHLFRGKVRHALLISSCASAATESHIRCSFTFWAGPNDYWGFVTVYYYTASNGTTYWASHYSTYWVNDHCYYQTNHPQSCRIHRHKGSW